MRVLLDTHVFLWWVFDLPRISSRVGDVMRDRRSELLLSVASAWEIAIKAGQGRLPLNETPEVFVPTQMLANAIQPLPVRLEHALHVFALPEHHKDPFDRLLVAQAQIEKLSIITADPQIARYAVEVIW